MCMTKTLAKDYERVDAWERVYVIPLAVWAKRADVAVAAVVGDFALGSELGDGAGE